MTDKTQDARALVERPAYLIRKRGSYYRPNNQGYTTSVIQAGRYTLAEAQAITCPNGSDGPIDGMTYIDEDEKLGDEDWALYRAALDRAEKAEAARDCLAALHGEDMALCTQLQHDAEDARAAGYAQGVRHVADRLRIMGDMGGQAIALALPQADAPAQENSHD